MGRNVGQARGRAGRLGAGLGLVVLVVVVTAAPASAVFTSNTVGCEGSAVMTAEDGTTYNANANDTTIRVPRDGTAHYVGSVSTVTHNHSGEIDLEIAMFKVAVGTWGPAKNASNLATSEGDKKIPSALGKVPPGKYRLSGSHRGDEGGCAGWANVEVAGSPLGSPVGVAAVALTAVSALGLLGSAFASNAKAVR